eukprot:SAG11_NODE_3175_length_2633_cov_2.028414_5_plen_81_part_01
MYSCKTRIGHRQRVRRVVVGSQAVTSMSLQNQSTSILRATNSARIFATSASPRSLSEVSAEWIVEVRASSEKLVVNKDHTP